MAFTSDDDQSDRAGTNTAILLVVGTGGFTHAAPVLELGRILSARGHRVALATHQGQEKWIEGTSFGFLTSVYTMGPPMDPETEAAHYLQMQNSDIRKSYRDYFRPKFNVDAFWASDYSFLKDICEAFKPDMIVADFFVDSAVRDIKCQAGIPITTVWPQMPYAMVGASYIPGLPGFQVDALTSEYASLWTRIRAAFRPLRAVSAVIPYLRFIREMRRKAGVNYTLPILKKPDYLVLVNSFWGLETPKDLPPLVAPIGPILAEEFEPLSGPLEAFFANHRRMMYVSFGTHIQVASHDLEKFVGAFSALLQEGLVDGIVWAANDVQRKLFDRDQTLRYGNIKICDILDNRDRSWFFTPFAPQRAILARRETVLFVTHGGGSSVNEATFHETPMLSIGFFFDQLLNGLRIQEAGVGLALDKANFSENEILEKSRVLLRDENGTIAQDVRRMGHIAQISARKKEFGADLIEEVLYDHRFSLVPPGATAGKSGHRRRPMHLQTADARMSAWKAQNWDLTSLAVASAAVVGYLSWTMVDALRTRT
ncbi:UDP-glucosyl transferase family protein [Annulohypoxylon truncatum]|uniref:UDP-glucosyl transferase family protein n=1 Tax=Annulohypoxylon truncatum TaxID=327061 RepID=UPI0020083186|nr:UDP-glucosyl transferase family protein [Annulohypoxylon truncatum]KAI1204353.1 UDP-glucosyl transferase family protein [Annulohypoxylon truncatum]